MLVWELAKGVSLAGSDGRIQCLTCLSPNRIGTLVISMYCFPLYVGRSMSAVEMLRSLTEHPLL